MKIKSLLIIVLACFVIIPSVVFASVANVEMNKLALKNYKQTAQSMTENQTYNISEYFRIISASAKQIYWNSTARKIQHLQMRLTSIRLLLLPIMIMSESTVS